MHNEAVNRLDFITGRAPITVDYEPGTVEIVEQHDGSKIALRKLNCRIQHPRQARRDELPVAPRGRGPDRHGAALRRQRSGRPALASRDRRAPLNSLGEKELCPGSATLESSTRVCGRRFLIPGPRERDPLLVHYDVAILRGRWRSSAMSFNHGFSATAFFTASTILPASRAHVQRLAGLSTLLRLEGSRPAGAPALQDRLGNVPECASIIVSSRRRRRGCSIIVGDETFGQFAERPSCPRSAR